MISYKRVLTSKKHEIRVSRAPARYAEMRKKAELEQVRIDGDLAELAAKIEQICTDYPVDFDALIDALDETELLKRRREQFEQIIKDMFPE